MEKEDFLRIADRTFSSRLLMGSARFPDKKTMQEAILESGATIVTVAMRRMPLNQEEGILSFIPPESFLLPNTAGCFTAKEAVFTAELSREALKTNWIKLEVIGDSKTLLPDGEELLKAAEELARKNFVVLPYCTDDLILCRKLIDVGCAAVMPLASPIGSGMGILNPYNLQILREEISHPIIVDAGIGTASDAAIAMELGADGILVNTAIACAHHPLFMAKGMRLACAAGRLAYLSGRISKKRYASASSPSEGVLTL